MIDDSSMVVLADRARAVGGNGGSLGIVELLHVVQAVGVKRDDPFEIAGGMIRTDRVLSLNSNVAACVREIKSRAREERPRVEGIIFSEPEPFVISQAMLLQKAPFDDGFEKAQFAPHPPRV